jgi:hypothetical protein
MTTKLSKENSVAKVRENQLGPLSIYFEEGDRRIPVANS